MASDLLMITAGAFAMTNTVLNAVIGKVGAKAMRVPLHLDKKEGCMEMSIWWKPVPNSPDELELVLRAYSNEFRQLAVCTFLHARGDGMTCTYRPPKK